MENPPSKIPASLGSLPVEILGEVFSHLAYEDLITGVGLACKHFRTIIHSGSPPTSLLHRACFRTATPIRDWQDSRYHNSHFPVLYNPIFDRLRYHCTASIDEVYVKDPNGGPDIKLIDSPLADENAVWPPVPLIAASLGNSCRVIVKYPDPEEEPPTTPPISEELRTPSVRDVMQKVADWFVTEFKPDWQDDYMTEEEFDGYFSEAENFGTWVRDWKWDWWYRWRGIEKAEAVWWQPARVNLEVRLKRIRTKWEE